MEREEEASWRTTAKFDFQGLIKEKNDLRFPGTRTWLLNDIHNWLDDNNTSNRIYLLLGSAGSGKSVIAATIALSSSKKKNHGVVSHFCRHDNPDDSRPIPLLTSLAAKICDLIPEYADAIDAAKVESALSSGLPHKVFDAFFREPLQSFSPPGQQEEESTTIVSKILIVIDALDELPREGRATFLRILHDLATLLNKNDNNDDNQLSNKNKNWISLFVTSREESDVHKALEKFRPRELRVEDNRNREDVESYIHDIARRFVRYQVSTEDLEQEVHSKYRIVMDGKLNNILQPMLKQRQIYDDALMVHYKCNNGDDSNFSQPSYRDINDIPSIKGNYTQPINDLDLLYKDANEARLILERLAMTEWKKYTANFRSIIPPLKGRKRAQEKMEKDYGGNPMYLKDLARGTLVFNTFEDLLLMATGLLQNKFPQVKTLKNKFASPTPIGYRDLNFVLMVSLSKGVENELNNNDNNSCNIHNYHLCEMQLNLGCIIEAKELAHPYYETIRKILPDICVERSKKHNEKHVDPGELEGFLMNRLCNSSSTAAAQVMVEKADGLMIYAHLLEEHLKTKVATTKGDSNLIQYKDFVTLPNGLYAMYKENFIRTFPQNDEIANTNSKHEDDIASLSWNELEWLIALIVSAREPLEEAFVTEILGWTKIFMEKAKRKISLVFPLRNGRFNVLHKSVIDWLRLEEADRFQLDVNILERAHDRMSRYLIKKVLKPLLLSANSEKLSKEKKPSLSFSEEYALRHVVEHLSRGVNAARDKLIEQFEKNKILCLRFVHLSALIKNCVALLPSIDEVIDKIGDELNITSILEYRRFIQQSSHILVKSPAAVYFLGSEWPDNTAPRKDYVELRRNNSRFTQDIMESIERSPALDALLGTFDGHTKSIESCCFSPINDRLLLTGSADNTIKIWDIHNGEVQTTIEGHSDEVTCCSFSSNGNYIISGSCDKSAKLWDSETSEIISSFEGHTKPIKSCCFSPDGDFIVTGSEDKTIRIWDTKGSYQLQHTLRGHKHTVISCCCYSNLVMSGSFDRTAKIWDINNGELQTTLRGHADWIMDCNFSYDGKYAVTGSVDKTIKVWIVQTVQLYFTIDSHLEAVSCCCFLPNNYDNELLIVAGCHDKITYIWNISSRGEKLITKFEGHSSYINCCSVSHDGKYVLTGSYDKTAKLWESPNIIISTESSSKLQFYPVKEYHRRSINCCSFSTDGSLVLTGSNDATAKVWNTKTRKLHVTLEGHTMAIRSACFSPNSKFIVTSGFDKALKLWRVSNGKLIATVGEAHSQKIRSCCFSPCGDVFLTGGSDKSVKLWNITHDGSSCELRTTFEVPRSIYDCSFSYDGKLAAIVCNDTTLRIWDIENGKLHTTIEEAHTAAIRSCSFSPKGYLVLTGSNDTTAKLWNISDSRKLQKSFKGHSSWIHGCCFSPSGKYVITAGSRDNTAKLWDIETETCISTYYSISGGIYCAAVSPEDETKIILGISTGEISWLKWKT